MEFCKYCKIASINSYCTCELNGEVCPYVRRCNIDMCYKPNNMDKCNLRAREDILDRNEYKVRFCLNNTLYVEVNDGVIQVKNPYDYEPKTVFLYQYDGGYHFEKKKEEQSYISKNNHTKKRK